MSPIPRRLVTIVMLATLLAAAIPVPATAAPSDGASSNIAAQQTGTPEDDVITVIAGQRTTITASQLVANDPPGACIYEIEYEQGVTDPALRFDYTELATRCAPESPNREFESLSFVPPASFVGPLEFRYTACTITRATCGRFYIARLYLTVVQPPVAVADGYTVRGGQELVVAAPGLLANDGGTLNCAKLVQGPGDGQLRGIYTTSPCLQSAGGAIAYRPDPGFVGTDEFFYRACTVPAIGPEGCSANVAAVTITVQPPVVNPSPSPSPTAPAPIAEDDAYSTPAGQDLVVPAPGLLANDAGDPTCAQLVQAPENGRVQRIFTTTPCLQATGGAFTYRPDPGFIGQDQFFYRACERDDAGTACSDIAVVTVTVTTATSPSPSAPPSVTPSPTASPTPAPSVRPSISPRTPRSSPPDRGTDPTPTVEPTDPPGRPSRPPRATTPPDDGDSPPPQPISPAHPLTGSNDASPIIRSPPA